MTFLSDHTFLIAIIIIGLFLLWKYILQPIANEGQSLDPEVPEYGLTEF